MTVPGGVPNLPTGALTIDTLAADTQDTSPEAVKSRAVGRFSPIFNSSTGGSPANDLTPSGVIVKLFAGFNSLVANADPADIQGPEDLPQLLVNFVESLPLVGQFVDLNDAVLGTYDGDDETLLAIQSFFVGIRADVVQAQADADAAADKWAIAIDALLGAGHSVADFIDLLQGLRDGKVTALAPPNSNRLDNPSFDGEVSIDDPSGDFVWDPTVYRTASANPDLSGSAKAIADGTDKELRSNLVGVAEGQIWTFVANLAAVGLAGTGNLVQLTVLPYNAAGDELPPVVLASSGVPTGSAIWAAPPAGTVKTAQLLSDWTVPAGVARVRLRTVLTANATAGSINLDDMNLSAKSLIPQYWVTDLTAALTGFTTWLTQIGQITSGQVVTAYNASVQQFKDWWNGTLGPAAQAQAAATLSARQQRKAQNDDILRDGWHTTYPLGSINDTAATLVGGKRTWWGAFNDNLLLTAQMLGLAPVPATIDADVGTATQLAAATASAAAASASLAQATNQDLTNQIVKASTGVDPGNATSSDAFDALTNIPYSNISGQYGANPVFGAVGGGNKTSGLTTSLSTSWTHTPAAADTMVVVLLEGTAPGKPADGSGISMSATWGGTAMTPMGPILVTGSRNSGSTWGYAQAFYIRIPAGSTTTKTVAAQITGGGTYNVSGLMGNSHSSSASKVAAYNYTISAGSSASITMTASTNDKCLLIGFFGGLDMGAWSGFNQQQRYLATGTGTYGVDSSCVFGDVTPPAGTTTIYFTASHAGTSSNAQFIGIVVQLSN